MESANGFADLKTSAYTGRYAPLSPFTFLQPDASSVETKGNLNHVEGGNYHHRCSSESFLIEEQPSWIEDLLNESETLLQRGHRRSASDSCAYLGEAAKTVTAGEETKHGLANVGACVISQNLVHHKDVDSTSIKTKTTSLVEKNKQESVDVASSSGVEHSREESNPQNIEGSADRASGSQVKPAGSKSDLKRAKQNHAHQSRVRKLQYIAHLERAVELLKAEASGILAELEFIEQQNMILTMENRALRQRLESVSQEQIIKQWEQGILEREIMRLQTLHHLQKQQQLQQQLPQNQYPKQRGNRGKDLDLQANSSSMKKKDTCSSEGSANGSAQA